MAKKFEIRNSTAESLIFQTDVERVSYMRKLSQHASQIKNCSLVKYDN